MFKYRDTNADLWQSFTTTLDNARQKQMATAIHLPFKNYINTFLRLDKTNFNHIHEIEHFIMLIMLNLWIDAGKSRIYIIKSIYSLLTWIACRTRRSAVDNESSATLHLRLVGARRKWLSPNRNNSAASVYVISFGISIPADVVARVSATSSWPSPRRF